MLPLTLSQLLDDWESDEYESPPRTARLGLKSHFDNMLTFDGEGDLWIDVGGGKAKGRDDDRQRPGLYRFRVCSQTLRQKSQVWDDMLSGPWRKRTAEPVDGSKPEEWVVGLPDHQPGAVAVVLAVIHNRLDMMPPSQNRIHINCEGISAILSVADEYDVVQLFSPFVSAWVQCGQLPHHIAGTSNYTVTLHHLNIAWQLGAVNLVRDAISHLLFSMTKVELDKLCDAAKNIHSIRIPSSLSKLVDALAAAWEKSIWSVLEFHYEVTDSIRRGARAGCKKAMFEAGDRAAVEAGTVAVPAQQELHSKERDDCNKSLLTQMAKNRDRREHLISWRWQSASEIDISLDGLFDRVAVVWGVGEFSNPYRIMVAGHDECIQALDTRLRNFRATVAERCLKRLLEPEQMSWLKERGDILETDARQLPTYQTA